jgi:threonine synthase
MLRSRGYPNVFIKDEGLNPTGSFKARGLSAAVTMARHFGLKKLAIPSAGNAASALAAYAAAASIEAHIFMPKDVPMANRIECDYYGAHVTLVDGLISDCAREIAKLKEKPAWSSEGWFDVSTTKEPYRVEGKKTMGYEVAEQLGWKLPQGIIYPTGGGVGLLGMWKAFDELEQLGFIGSERPNMISVQSAGCAPIVKAWDEGRATAEMWPHASTLASGLRVPKPYADYLISRHSEEKRRPRHRRHRSRNSRRHSSLGKGGRNLRRARRRRIAGRLSETAGQRFFSADDTVVLFNTGSGLKYLDVLDTKDACVERAPSPASRPIAGIIGPY